MDELDDAFRSSTRLKIAAFLSGCDEAEFRAVQDYCELTPSTLSKQVSALVDAGYLLMQKGYVGKRPRTWLSLTKAGRRALSGHLTALRQIADAAANHAGTS